MPVPYYNLDDRSFEDIVSEMLSRIPGHTPEWTNPRIGDPGRTLIDLFAWLADTLLYRANLIPERQRLSFLRLLNIPMRAAVPATGLVTLETAQGTVPASVPLYTQVKGPVGFETIGEITVLPVQGQFYIKRQPTPDEKVSHGKVIEGLKSAYEVLSGTPYFTTPIFSGDQVKREGVDFIRDSVDSCLWIALLAAKKETVSQVLNALGRDNTGAKPLNVGLLPRLETPSFDEGIKTPACDVWDWEISSSRVDSLGEPEYLSLDVLPGTDTTAGFSKQGVVRLVLPDSDDIGLPENDVTRDYMAGVGNRPPRIDDEETASRLVAWIRLRPVHITNSLILSWAGINAVEIDQRKMMSNTVVATSNGMTDQVIQLPAQSIDPNSLLLQVEEPDQGFVTWRLIGDLARASRDDSVYQLDPEAGTVTFGNGVCGRVPFPGMRIRIAAMRYGGGANGNLAPGNLTGIAQANLKVKQPIATSGGANAETLDAAEKRIPAFLKNGDRAVTTEDYKRLALNTPAVDLGRVEVLPKFKPQQKRSGIPGVVSVMVIPKAASLTPPNPRADWITLERVHSYLDSRRPLAVELYVISVDYVPLGLSVAVTVRDGHARDQVLSDVRNALRDYLWPLSPGGNDGNGWPLGQTVSSRELLVAVARVTGVRTVTGVNLFQQRNGTWERVPFDSSTGAAEIPLDLWQLPELLSIVVIEDGNAAPESLSGSATGGLVTGDKSAIPIPVVPEVC